MNRSVVVLTLASAIVTGTPLVLAALGEILAERSGVMNLGVEGLMLLGAVVGIGVSFLIGDPWVALLVGAIAGAMLASVHAVLAVSLGVNQIVSGLALVIVGTGLSSFIGKIPDSPLIGRKAVESFGPVLPRTLRDVPVIGPALFGHDLVIYLSWLLVGLASFYLFRTRAGLAVRAVGEDPATADADGLRVSGIRYGHVLVGGALAGLGGAYFSIAVTGIWADGITAGIGWIAFALVSFSGWRPWPALFAAYVFGALTNLSFTLQIAGIRIPGDFLAMIPFVMTILVLIAVSSRPRSARWLSAPAALATPYRRESR